VLALGGLFVCEIVLGVVYQGVDRSTLVVAVLQFVAAFLLWRKSRVIWYLLLVSGVVLIARLGFGSSGQTNVERHLSLAVTVAEMAILVSPPIRRGVKKDENVASKT
jgi:hypothetical protein